MLICTEHRDTEYSLSRYIDIVNINFTRKDFPGNDTLVGGVAHANMVIWFITICYIRGHNFAFCT